MQRDSAQTTHHEVMEPHRRRVFLENLNEDFARLRADPDSWRDELEERAAWDQTLSDGLDEIIRNNGVSVVQHPDEAPDTGSIKDPSEKSERPPD